VILTIDSGTSVIKVTIWDRDGVVGTSGIALDTRHPFPGRAEQDPMSWWTSVVTACDELGRRVPAALGSVEVVGCTGARQTFAPVDRGGRPTGAGILWSDRRAGREAERVAAATGVAPGSPSPAGIVLDAASVAAKLAWLADHEQDSLAAATWLMTPRDLVLWHLTGAVATDVTMASRSGLYDMDGTLVEGLAGPVAAKLPPVVAPDQVVGSLLPEAAAATHLPVAVPVVIGAGDRASEVLGASASGLEPMVSWGTTANVSVPVAERPIVPPGIVASRAADGGWLLEGGLSAAGSLLAWLSRLTGRTPDELAAAAEDSLPGARGVVATPWLDGARAPWWRPAAAAAFVGVGPAHGPADLARALFEAVGWDVARCLEAMASRLPAGPPVTELVLAGSGAGSAA
jgi:xylulokinase